MSFPKTESVPMQDLNDSGCVQDSSVCENGYKRHAQLLDLSDDVLLYILKHCSPRDLKALGFTCLRLAALVCDHTLWQRVDCRDGRTGQQRLRWLLTHGLYCGTTELKIKGYVDTNIKCLGIQEPFSPFPLDNRAVNPVPVLPGSNMADNVLFRMWYPHLPRSTVSPRWPDRSGLANSENVDKPNSSDLPESSNKIDEGDSSVGEPGSSGQDHASSLNREPSSTKCDEPSCSKCNEPSSSNCVEPCTSKHSEPGTSKRDEPSISKHNEPGTLKCDKPSSSKCEEPCTSKTVETSSSKYSEPDSLNRESPGCSKQVEQISSHQPNILNMCEPSASSEADMPIDVTVSRSSSGPAPRQSRPFSKPTHNCPGPQFTFTTKLMRDIKYTCTQLTALFIEYCDIDYKATNMSHFPPKLKKLSLRGTRCYNQPLHSSYLCKIQDHLPDLEYLDVSCCEWFEPASLMPVSKVPKLEELYMCRCVRLTECVAYASLAARYGFRKLRVLDARGSPLADSEVSALGWLPLLEELYVAPPGDEQAAPEHMHGWREWLPSFHELDQWELEEPEYFKSKIFEAPDSPPPENSNGTESQTSAIAEIREHRPLGDAVGENPWGCFERRIIVIQPSQNREIVVQPNNVIPVPPLRRLLREQGNVIPAPPLRRLLQDQEDGPRRRGLRRPHNDQALDLIKRPRLNEGADCLNQGADRLNEGVDRLNEGAGRLNEGADRLNEGADRLNEGAGRLNESADRLNEGADRLNEGADRLNEGAGRLNEGADRLNEGADRLNEGADRLNEGADRLNEGEDHPNECGVFHVNCPRAQNAAQYYDGPSSAAHLLMRMGTDTNNRPFYHNNCYDLVTDSAVFRFGRGENEHVVHLGLPPINESRTRPDRSNLRVLSITGFRNITDRSLVHLATAAPHLRLVDFTHTNVTWRGVEIFKAIRSDCEIKYSKFV